MSDTFRKEYRPLSDEAKQDMNRFKSLAEYLLVAFEVADTRTDVDKRMMALAKTNLEQAVMWAIKAIT